MWGDGVAELGQDLDEVIMSLVFLIGELWV